MKADLFTISGGNTNLSVGIHENSKLNCVLNLEDFKSLLNKDKKHLSIPTFGSFTKEYEEIGHLGLQDFSLAPHIENNQFLDMPVQYTETIGNDRIVASYYCFKGFATPLDHEEKIAFIDCGTFTTVNIIQDAKGYLGGYIYPGIELLKSNYLQGAHLHEPRLEKISSESPLPHSTEDAIQFAFHQLLKAKIEILSTLNIQKVVITGGAAQHLLHLLENPIHIPNLLHSALGQLHQIVRNNRK